MNNNKNLKIIKIQPYIVILLVLILLQNLVQYIHLLHYYLVTFSSQLLMYQNHFEELFFLLSIE